MTAGRDDPERTRSAEEILAGAGWAAVQTALLRGVAHDLSGRAAALGGLVELARMGDEDLRVGASPGNDGEGRATSEGEDRPARDGEDLPAGGGEDLPAGGGEPSTVELLREESERLVETVELLRLLASDGEGDPPEPLSLEPLLSGVLALHARHRGLEPVEAVLDVDPEVAPVRVRRALLVKVLLLLLGAAGWAVRNTGERRLEVGLRQRDDRVVVSFGLPAVGPDGGDSVGQGSSGQGAGGPSGGGHGPSDPSGGGHGPVGQSPGGGQRTGPDLEEARRGAEEVLEADGAEVARVQGAEGRSHLELSLPPLQSRKS